MTETTPERPESLPRRIVRWYAENPGMHRCVDVATALNALDVDVTTAQVATFSRRKAERGDLVRDLVPVEGWTRKMTLYGAAPAAPVTPQE